jgi:hypothetical protein
VKDKLRAIFPVASTGGSRSLYGLCPSRIQVAPLMG